MGWWITAAALFLLAILPLGGKVCYDEAGARVFLGVGPVRFMVYPSKRKKKSSRRPRRKRRRKRLLPGQTSLRKRRKKSRTPLNRGKRAEA